MKTLPPLTIAATAAPAEASRVADVLPPDHHVSQSLTRWFMEEVTERMDGAIHFPPSRLGAPQDVPALVRDGIGFVVPTFVPETLPLTDVAAPPRNDGGACQGSEAPWSLVDEGVLAQAELAPAGYKAIMAYVDAPHEIFTAHAPVTSVADLEGPKLRTAGGALDMTARALGAVSVRMSTPEIHESLSRGTIDGLVFGFDELASHGTLGGQLRHRLPHPPDEAEGLGRTVGRARGRLPPRRRRGDGPHLHLGGREPRRHPRHARGGGHHLHPVLRRRPRHARRGAGRRRRGVGGGARGLPGRQGLEDFRAATSAAERCGSCGPSPRPMAAPPSRRRSSRCRPPGSTTRSPSPCRRGTSPPAGPGRHGRAAHPAPRRRLLVVTDGALEVTTSDGEARVFRPGDPLEVADTPGAGHRSRSVFVALDDARLTDRPTPLDPPEPGPVPTRCISDGARPRFAEAPMAYRFGGPSGKVAREAPVTVLQAVRRPGALNHDFHSAPRR